MDKFVSINNFKSFSPISLIFILFVFQISCDNSVGTNGSIPKQFITNFSFELSGQPSFNGWELKDSTGTLFSNDVPFGGGSTSLSLQNGNWAKTSFLVSDSLKGFRFTVSAKLVKNADGNDSARVAILRVLDGVTIFWGLFYVSDTLWHQYTLTQRIYPLYGSAQSPAAVILYSPYLNPQDRMLYDLCTFVQTE